MSDAPALAAKTTRPPPELGPTVLLASGRVGRRVDVHAPGKAVYIGSNGTLLCTHGECMQTILYWLAEDSRLPEGAQSARVAACVSVCTCTDVQGLKTKQRHIQPSDWPQRPSSLYDFLEGQGSEIVAHTGRTLRYALTNAYGSEVYVNGSGTKQCRHGNSQRVLERQKKRKGPPQGRSKSYQVCACVTMKTPQRQGSVFSYHKK